MSPITPHTARIIEIHQLEGQDDRDRVFNRRVEVARAEKGYRGVFHYEGVTVETEPRRTINDCLVDLVGRLQQLGFHRLRSRVNFRGPRYLAEREPWVDYPDRVPG
jgi:hypothetical protein